MENKRDIINDTLKHYGILGMKWGIRRKYRRSYNSSRGKKRKIGIGEKTILYKSLNNALKDSLIDKKSIRNKIEKKLRNRAYRTSFSPSKKSKMLAVVGSKIDNRKNRRNKKVNELGIKFLSNFGSELYKNYGDAAIDVVMKKTIAKQDDRKTNKRQNGNKNKHNKKVRKNNAFKQNNS